MEVLELSLGREPNQVMSYFYGVSGSDSDPYGAYQTTSLLALNEWNNLVLTRNLVTLKVRFFLNGLLDVTFNLSIQLIRSILFFKSAKIQ